MPWQIRLHWLVAILLVITCVTIELRGFAEPGSAPVRAGCHPLQLRRNGVCADDRPPVSALAPPFARYRAQTAEVANRLAHLTHTLIYLLLLTLPVLGVYSRYLGGKVVSVRPADAVRRRGGSAASADDYRLAQNAGVVRLLADRPACRRRAVPPLYRQDNALVRMLPLMKSADYPARG